MSRAQETALSFHVGNHVRIKQSIRSPYAGHCGTICQVDTFEVEIEYLVRFEDGLAFRYTANEMELVTVAA